MHACTGKKYILWFGVKPRLGIMDPALVKEILSRPSDFQKPRKDQMAEVLGGGLFTTEGSVWTKHKKILNPSFHIEKIKVYCSCFSILNLYIDHMHSWQLVFMIFFLIVSN